MAEKEGTVEAIANLVFARGIAMAIEHQPDGCKVYLFKDTPEMRQEVEQVLREHGQEGIIRFENNQEDT